MPIEPGLTHTVEHVVAGPDTAEETGSGTVPVLATPRVVALAEEATWRAVQAELDDGQTTVGMRIQLDHLAPIAVGSKVVAEATLEKVDGKRLTFTINVSDDSGLVAAGKITRAVVHTKKFLEKAR